MRSVLIHLACLWLAMTATGLLPEPAAAQGTVLRPESFKHFVDSFNLWDHELYPQFISNAKSWEFLSANIPLLDCPDKQLEQTYYFRWWTYRKHIRKTPEGFVILEFLPDVSWAGKYNTINCAAALHVYEGRWLHDSQYISDYIKFWYRGGGDMEAYSCWMADALWNQSLVKGDRKLAISLEADLVREYANREKAQLDSNGLYWQIDGKDGMEMSICGGNDGDRPAYRATINSYQYGDAMAIARIADWSGQREAGDLFRNKALTLKINIERLLWDDTAQFFKVLQKPVADSGYHKGMPLCSARELHGYTPWLFSLPSSRYSVAWKFLMDPRYFYAPYGPTTAEQGHPGFDISYKDHECQWNGPSWPMATSITLTAMANLINNYPPSPVRAQDFFKLLLQYAGSQQRTWEDGRVVPWIDENLNPFNGDWISRTRLSTWENGHWSKEKGGPERGKDYNHSTFCDLVITGLIGLRPSEGNTVLVNPMIPAGTWDYFCLDHLTYHGKMLTILYDRLGTRYHRGRGMMVFVDGRKAAASPVLKKIMVRLEH